MNCEVRTIAVFDKNIKRLHKKFPKIKNDLVTLINKLKLNPKLGIELGNNIFKIRIPNSSIPIGKSGGFRVITYYFKDNIIYLITIYSKTEIENILTEEIKKIINNKFKGE